ncbi:hypothetical protein EMIT0P43_40535 [Pseudomonas jessenii]
MHGFGFACCAAGSVALSLAGFFVGVGVSAASAFHPVEFAGRYEVVAVVTAGQVPADFEMSDHWNVSFVTCERLTPRERGRSIGFAQQKIPVPGRVVRRDGNPAGSQGCGDVRSPIMLPE